MSSYEELNEQFHTIKEMAWRGKSFKPYQGVNGKPDDEKERLGYSLVNMYFLETMKHIYARHRLKPLDDAEAQKEVEALRLRYISKKQAEDAHAKSNHELDVIRQKTGQLTRELIDYEGKSQKEVFELLFCHLIPAYSDNVTAEKIKEGAGYFLITGENNLTEEEKKELKKRYA